MKANMSMSGKWVYRNRLFKFAIGYEPMSESDTRKGIIDAEAQILLLKEAIENMKQLLSDS